MILFNVILAAVAAAISLVSRLVFMALASLFLLSIHAFKMPVQAMQAGLDVLADWVRACAGFVLESIFEALRSLVSSGLEFLVDAFVESITATGSAAGGLAEKAWASLNDCLSEALPDLAGDVSEMMGTVLSDLWNNYVEAAAHVTNTAS